MKKKFLAGLAIGLFIIGMVGMASADLIGTRGELDTLLGGNQVFEDFESFTNLYQIYFTSQLTSTSIILGQGPGLVEEGAIYDGANGLWINTDGYYALNSKTLADSSGWRNHQITIFYTTLVQAFGFDMQGYIGYRSDGIISVFDTGGALITETPVSGRGFFGWEHAEGIGSVRISANSGGYIMLDNHGYGQTIDPIQYVTIDIKPGSDPNCFNSNGSGALPVAILGSADLSAEAIDPGTILLEGLAVKVVGKANNLLAHLEDVNGDGYTDLVVQIADSDGLLIEGISTATVTGALYDGTAIQGSDSICLVP